MKNQEEDEGAGKNNKRRAEDERSGINEGKWVNKDKDEKE
jgi:hypothetical protein